MSPPAPPAPAYVLPAGTAAGTYIIQAVYNGTTNFLGYTDNSQTWSISAAATATAAASASATFSIGGAERDAQRDRHQRRRHGQRRDRDLHHPQRHHADRHRRSRSTSRPAPPTPAYVLPAGTPAGTYIIQAVYNGTTNFLGYTDTSQTLVDQRRGDGDGRGQRLGDVQRRGADRAAQRDRHQRRRHGQRGHRDLHHPQRHDADRHRRHGQRLGRRRRRQPTSCPPARRAAPTSSRPCTTARPTSSASPTPATTLVVSAAATATAAASASATFSTGGQNVPLNATVTSPPARSTKGPRPSPSSAARP